MFLWGTLFSFDVFVMLPQFVMSLGRTVDNKEDSDPCQDGQKKNVKGRHMLLFIVHSKNCFPSSSCWGYLKIPQRHKSLFPIYDYDHYSSSACLKNKIQMPPNLCS